MGITGDGGICVEWGNQLVGRRPRSRESEKEERYFRAVFAGGVFLSWGRGQG